MGRFLPSGTKGIPVAPLGETGMVIMSMEKWVKTKNQCKYKKTPAILKTTKRITGDNSMTNVSVRHKDILFFDNNMFHPHYCCMRTFGDTINLAIFDLLCFPKKSKEPFIFDRFRNY